MKLRRKTLVIFGVTFASLILIQYAASQLIFLNSFATLEEQDMNQNVGRARSALFDELSYLDSYVYDWAAWDDTYAFIQDSNEDYIESNLVDETFTGSELNLMLFINSSGEIVFGKAFDLENEEETSLPESLIEHLTSDSVLLQHSDTDSSVSGILLLPEDPMLIVSRPIITSNDEGPILGSLIMGYYFDSTRLEGLAETTHLSLNLQQFDDAQMPADFQEAVPSLLEEETIIMPISSNYIAGYTLLEDVYGQPCLVLRVDVPRSIYKQGQASISFFLLWLLTAGITSTIVVILLLEKTVLSRLSKLNSNVNSIRSHGDHSDRVEAYGKDELADLANEINKMLTTLEKAQNNLQMLNEKLGVVGSLTRHDARNKLAVIANNLYLAKQKLTNEPNVLEYLAEAEVAIDQVKKIFDFAKTYEKLGREELNYVAIDKCIKEISMLIDLNSVKLAVECPDLRVLADSLLGQLFYNLIDNSLKHGEKVNQIRIHCKAEENQIDLIYEDDGVGVPKAEKEKIFEEGYGKGTGYGLYLIRKISEAYGWTIQETGTPGKGVQFTMTIPKMNENGKENYHCS